MYGQHEKLWQKLLVWRILLQEYADMVSTLSLSLSLSHTHTHTHTHSLTLTHFQTLTGTSLQTLTGTNTHTHTHSLTHWHILRHRQLEIGFQFLCKREKKFPPLRKHFLAFGEKKLLPDNIVKFFWLAHVLGLLYPYRDPKVPRWYQMRPRKYECIPILALDFEA